MSHTGQLEAAATWARSLCWPVAVAHARLGSMATRFISLASPEAALSLISDIKHLEERTTTMKISTSNSTVTIDGRTFNGRNVTIQGDKVIVDGEEQTGSLIGPVTVVVNGNADSVETTSGTVRITGSAGRVKTMSGDVHCGDVQGDVGTMSGDVTCAAIAGNAKTMSGDIVGGVRR